MATTIFAANDSSVQVNGKPVEGVRSIEYHAHQARTNVYALGSAERVGVISGAQAVEGSIRVASTAAALDGLKPDETFSLLVSFKQGQAVTEVAFDDCVLTDKTFDMSASGFGEAAYAFTAVRIR
jgi:hypothetical protein